MSWENALLMKLSNDVEKYEGQNYSFFLTVHEVRVHFLYSNNMYMYYGMS